LHGEFGSECGVAPIRRDGGGVCDDTHATSMAQKNRVRDGDEIVSKLRDHGIGSMAVRLGGACDSRSYDKPPTS
jgi:hypothetical protein